MNTRPAGDVIRRETSISQERRAILIGVPSSAGARRTGQEGGPAALRAAGLARALRDRGVSVQEAGDLPASVFRPDAASPRQQNIRQVANVAANVADAVASAFGAGGFLLLLGGDCTITIGALAGLARCGAKPGLVYLDGDLDLNTPDTSPSGAFDGMVTAHLVGRGAPQLARIGPAFPLLEESRLVYFGFNTAAGGIDPPELDALSRSAALQFPLEVVRNNPAAAARAALAVLGRRTAQFLLHFDVDVTESQAVDVAHRGGLSTAQTIEALEIFVADPGCIGLVVTEFNPALDADGTAARQCAAVIADSIGRGLARRGC